MFTTQIGVQNQFKFALLSFSVLLLTKNICFPFNLGLFHCSFCNTDPSPCTIAIGKYAAIGVLPLKMLIIIVSALNFRLRTEVSGTARQVCEWWRRGGGVGG